MRLYQPIWQRVRANPGIRVPIECPNAFTLRVCLAVKKERAMDKVYNRVTAAKRKQGIVYKTIATHPEKDGFAMVSFVLIEYSAGDYSDLKYLVRFPPPPNLAELIGLKEMEAEMYNRVPRIPDADIVYEKTVEQKFDELITLAKELKGINDANLTR